MITNDQEKPERTELQVLAFDHLSSFDPFNKGKLYQYYPETVKHLEFVRDPVREEKLLLSINLDNGISDIKILSVNENLDSGIVDPSVTQNLTNISSEENNLNKSNKVQVKLNSLKIFENLRQSYCDFEEELRNKIKSDIFEQIKNPQLILNYIENKSEVLPKICAADRKF